MTINKAIIIGNLGNDPKCGVTKNGKKYASFSVATTKKWKDADGEKKDKTTWHNISVWGNLADICELYLEKGSQVYIEGEIEYEKYTDKKDGIEKTATKIVASNVTIIKGKARDDRKEVDKHNEAKANAYVAENEELDLSDDIPF